MWALTRVAFLVLAWLVTAVAPDRHLAHTPWSLWPFRVFLRYDAGFFFRIAESGYPAGGPHLDRAAFFPGYPLAGRLVAEVFGLGRPTDGNLMVAQALVAWACAAVAAVLLWKHVDDTSGPRVATASVVVLLAGPYSLFLMAPYSESMFLALALGAWMCAYRRRWWWAGTLCALAGAVRVNGLFLLGGIAVVYVLDARETGRRIVRTDALPLLLPVTTVFGYFAFLHHLTGHWNTWFEVQRIGWYRRLTPPWQSLWNSVKMARYTIDPAPRLQAYMELVFAVLIVVGIVALARSRCWPEVTYVGLGALALLTSTFYQSVPRSTLVAFPLVAVAARWAVTERRRPLVWLAAAASLVLLTSDVTFFVHDHIAG